VDEFISPEDLEWAGDFIFESLSPGTTADWDELLAGTLLWTVRETVVHMASTCVFYSVHLVSEARSEIPVTLASAGDPPNLALLSTVTVTPRVLAAAARCFRFPRHGL
jgi:hypothetical protein